MFWTSLGTFFTGVSLGGFIAMGCVVAGAATMVFSHAARSFVLTALKGTKNLVIIGASLVVNGFLTIEAMALDTVRRVADLLLANVMDFTDKPFEMLGAEEGVVFGLAPPARWADIPTIARPDIVA